MPVIQVTYDVPIALAKGLATGELKMLGTAAIRNRTGIAAHVKEISRTVGGGENAIGASIAKSLKDPKVVVIGLGVVAVAAVGGGVAGWVARRKQQDAKPEVPECVARYNASLGAYLEAIGTGSLDADLIARLISDLDAVKEDSESGKIALEFSVEESEALVNLVADYTSKLAEANWVELSVFEATTAESADSPVIDLRRYLEGQRQIFDKSA
jgi:hypothetical protein